MATWVYKCEECEITFVTEVEDGKNAAEKATCPQCGCEDAAKQFEMPKQSGGCGCGSGSCC